MRGPAAATYAAELCHHLNVHVLDEDLEALTLLDALASCGITLVEDPNGEASDAYLQILASWD